MKELQKKNRGGLAAKILLAPLVLIMMLLAGGCAGPGGGGGTASTAAGDVLKVGVTANSPPLVYKQNGKITGLEAEFARELARFAGKEVRFIEVAWEDQIPSLVEGKTDIIMSGMTITDLRRYSIDFSEPYLVSGQVSLVRRDEFNHFSSGLGDLLNIKVRVGSVADTTGSYLVQHQLRGNKHKEFSTPQKGVEALLAKEIDAFLYDLPMNFYFGALNEAKGLVPVPVPLSREFLAWGVRKDDPELLATANRFVVNLKESGKLQEMVQRWIPFYRNVYNQ